MTHRYDLTVSTWSQGESPAVHTVRNVAARDFNQAYQIAIMYAVVREPGCDRVEILSCQRISEEGEEASIVT